MRRLTAVLLAILMMLTLCACGAQDAKPNDNAAGNNNESTQNEPNTPNDDNTEENVLRIGMECAYAPNNWQESAASETNLPIENVPGAYAEGYDVQIARLVCEQLGCEPVIVMLAWDGLIEALNQGQIDMIIAGMADTAERRQAINFSEPYHVTEYGIMVNSDSPYVGATSIQDFAGASVLGQKDTQLDTVIDQMEGVEHLTPVASVPNMISRLQEGTCDALVINVENSSSYLQANPDFVVIRFEQGKGFDLGFVGACVGLRLEDTELLENVNAALETIDDPTRDELWNIAVENQPK